MPEFYDKPCAAPGLFSFRYRGRYGWIMIGARNAIDALHEAARSTDGPVTADSLEHWDILSGQYAPAGGANG